MQELFRFPVDLAGINLVERDAMRPRRILSGLKSYALRLETHGFPEDDGRGERVVQ